MLKKITWKSFNWAFAILWQIYKGVTYHTWMNWLTQRGTFERTLLHHPQNIAIWVGPRRRYQSVLRQWCWYMANILLYLSEIKLSILTTANVSKTSHQQIPLNPSNSVDWLHPSLRKRTPSTLYIYTIHRVWPHFQTHRLRRELKIRHAAEFQGGGGVWKCAQTLSSVQYIYSIKRNIFT